MEWKEVKLSELGDIVGGATPSTKEPLNYDGDISWITPKDLSTFSERYISKGERSITKKGFESCSCKMLPEGSILFSSRAPIGYVAIAKNELCTNQGFKSVIPNKKKVDNIFLFYLLKHNKNRIENLGSGTTFKEVSGSVMKDVKVRVPSLEDQIKIASILSSLDAKIENNNKINANLEAQAQALFKSWFIDFEPFQNGEFEDSELGRIPKGWKVGTLKDIAIINPTLKLSKSQDATYLDMKNMPTSGSFPNKWEIKPYNGGMKFQNGDTLMARITPCLENGKVAYVNFLKEDEVGFGSTEYIVIRPKNGIFPELFYFLCRYNDFVGYATKNMNGSSGRQRVSAETIGNYKMIIPPINILLELAPLFSSIMNIIRVNGFKNIYLSTLRDTLLPKLMSGEIEV